MPKPRNYWVLRGVRGQGARQKLLDYYAGVAEIEDNVGQGAAKPPTVPLYLDAFSVPLATDHIMRDSASTTAWNGLKNFAGVSTRVAESAGAKTPVDIPSYKAPRVVRVTLDATGVRAVSKRTGLPYLKYDHTSLSIPFGVGSVGETIAEAFGTISAGMIDSTHKARLINERY